MTGRALGEGTGDIGRYREIEGDIALGEGTGDIGRYREIEGDIALGECSPWEAYP